MELNDDWLDGFPIAVAKSYAPGHENTVWQPGDFILTHRHNWYSWLIRFGERLRLSKSNRKYGYWNHTALVFDEKGTLIEALVRGVQISNVEKYKDQEYTVVNLNNMAENDRNHVLVFGLHCVGEPYGFFTVLCLAIWALVGGKFVMGLDGTETCSGLVARSIERYGLIFPKNPLRMMPSDLAEFFNVEIPNA